MAANPISEQARAIPKTLSERLVYDWLHLEPRSIPEHVLARTTMCVKDTLGVAVAARTLGVGVAASQVALEAGGPEKSTVWGAARGASPEDAAFANGMLAHALDFDDTHAAAIMHSSCMVVPTALALGEALRVPGRELLASMVIGYQVAARLGRLAPGPFQDHGFQATSVLGAFASTFVAARLLGLTAEETVNALGTAGSMASGLMAYLSDGSDVKQMHAGWAAMSGIRAARLAKAGFRGPSAVFEYKFGVFKSFARVDISEKWQAAGGEAWEVEHMAPKPYPACLCAHAGVQAILKLRAAGRIGPGNAGDIANVHTDVPNWYVGLIFEPAGPKAKPRTPYEARFSGPWTMARALLDGKLDVWSFAPERISDPAALAIAEKCTYAVEALPEFPAAFPARVTVTMKSGEKHVEYIAHNLGTPGNPMTPADMNAKFASCAEPALGEARAGEISRRIDALITDDGARALYAALRGLEVATPVR
jgi:2-methylcitrate dehydratase PrpD